MPREFDQVVDGKPYYETQGVNYEQCCDCGLVHKVKYEVHDADGNRIKGAKVYLQVWRANGMTKTARRKIRKPALVIK